MVVFPTTLLTRDKFAFIIVILKTHGQSTAVLLTPGRQDSPGFCFLASCYISVEQGNGLFKNEKSTYSLQKVHSYYQFRFWAQTIYVHVLN